MSEYKTVIQQSIFSQILQRNESTNTQFELRLKQNLRRRQVIQINDFNQQLISIKFSKEKVQRKVDNVLSKLEENPFEKLPNETDQSLLNLRSLRHHYLQSKIPRNQLYLLAEQGVGKNEIYLAFKHELDIIDSENSLDLIRYITSNISLLLEENGSIAEKPLLKYFQHHHILFLADFQLLLNRYGMVDLDDLIDLLVVSKLAKAEEIKSYAKNLFCLNVKYLNCLF